MNQADALLFQSILKGQEEGLVELYRLHRTEFIKWAWQQFKLDEHDAADVFQDTIISLRSNIVKGKLTELSSTLKTYLFGIGKNIALGRLRQNGKWYKNPELMEVQEEKSSITTKIEESDRTNIVSGLLENIGEPCLSILRLYYYQNYSMEAIANTLDYKNENVVKSQKLRCLKKLKENMKLVNKEELY